MDHNLRLAVKWVNESIPNACRARKIVMPDEETINKHIESTGLTRFNILTIEEAVSRGNAQNTYWLFVKKRPIPHNLVRLCGTCSILE